MLLEIRCSAFAHSGENRNVVSIVFHSGLNVVCGGDKGDNSIGKTTFLKIVDFAFGADDYPTEDIQTQIGDHAVEFAFEFSGERFHFRRETKTKDIVHKCDSQYAPTEEIPLSDYRRFLLEKYGLGTTGLSFREYLGAFSRIYGKKAGLGEDPLYLPGDDKKKTLVRLMKIFGKYGAIEEFDKALSTAAHRKKTYKDAEKAEIVQVISSAEKKENDRKLQKLNEEIERLQHEFGTELSTASDKAELLSATMKTELAKLMRRRSNLRTNLELLDQNNDDIAVSLANSFEDLKEFFPEADLRKIQEVENFHRELKKILDPRIARARKDIASRLSVIESKIDGLHKELESVSQEGGASGAILRTYAEKVREVERLSSANEAFGEARKIEDDAKIARKNYLEAFDDAGVSVVNSINADLQASNAEICGEEVSVPRFSMRDGTRYAFENKNDHGAGASNRGVLQFHLAVLRLTKLPVLIEDSDNFKTIEDRYVLKLLELFAREEKQIFVALDRVGHYSEDGNVPVVISDNVVLRLSKGNELFGRAWNVEDDS